MHAEGVSGNWLTWLQKSKGPGQAIFKMENQKAHYCNSVWVWKLQNWETNIWCKTHSPHTKAPRVLVSNTWSMTCFGKGGQGQILPSFVFFFLMTCCSLNSDVYMEEPPPQLTDPHTNLFWKHTQKKCSRSALLSSLNPLTFLIVSWSLTHNM